MEKRILVSFVASWTICLLLLSNSDHEVEGSARNQMGRCSKNDISVAQGFASIPSAGIRTFLVEIANTNVKAAIGNIHLSCGQFSSAKPINPKIFKRVAVDDCLVKNGSALVPGEIVSFKYASTKEYLLSVSRFTC